MNIVTVFNYPNDTKYNVMFKIWMTQALRCKSNSTCIKDIIVLTKALNTDLEDYIKKLNCSYVKIKVCDQFKLINPPEHRWHHNVGFKLFNICNEKEPYIFIDADAIFITTSLDDTVAIAIASKDHPVIGVNHQTIPRHTDAFNFRFINTGFLIVSKPEFLDFHTILNTPIKYKCPGTDQLLIYNYFRVINYDYTHPLIDWGWNSCAGFKKILPSGICVSDGIKEQHTIHVLHYWDEFKPWMTRCEVYDSFTNDIKVLDNIYPHIVSMSRIDVINLYFRCKTKENCRMKCMNRELLKDMSLVNVYGSTHANEDDEFDIIAK